MCIGNLKKSGRRSAGHLIGDEPFFKFSSDAAFRDAAFRCVKSLPRGTYCWPLMGPTFGVQTFVNQLMNPGLRLVQKEPHNPLGPDVGVGLTAVDHAPRQRFLIL